MLWLWVLNLKPQHWFPGRVLFCSCCCEIMPTAMDAKNLHNALQSQKFWALWANRILCRYSHIYVWPKDIINLYRNTWFRRYFYDEWSISASHSQSSTRVLFVQTHVSRNNSQNLSKPYSHCHTQFSNAMRFCEAGRGSGIFLLTYWIRAHWDFSLYQTVFIRSNVDSRVSQWSIQPFSTRIWKSTCTADHIMVDFSCMSTLLSSKTILNTWLHSSNRFQKEIWC